MKHAMWIFIIFSVFISHTVMAKMTFSGRTPKIDGALWQVNEEPFILSPSAELFCSVYVNETLIIGGSFEDQGVLFAVDKDKKVSQWVAEGSRVIYCALIESEDSILIGGLHHNLGGAVWRFNIKDKTVSKAQILDDATVVYALAKFDNRLFAGGVSRGNGKIWSSLDDTWDKGQLLYNAVEVTSLCSTKIAIYAAGLRKNKSGGYWLFQGDSWKEGQSLKFADAIYTSCVDQKGFLYFGGAGQEGKVIWENTKGFWNARSLEDGLAVYTLYLTKDGSIFAAGWNKERKGAYWQTFKDGEWKKGSSLSNCFVVRSITE